MKARIKTIDKLAPMEYSLKLRLKKGCTFFGPGVAQLLILVGETQSLNIAAQTMEMAYSKAWNIIKVAEEALGYPLLIRKVGGINGGGSIVTDEGKELVKQYMKFQEEAYALADVIFEKYLRPAR